MTHVMHATPWTLIAMWFGMMSLMMGPTVSPWVVAFYRFDPTSPAARRLSATGAFVAGYALAWLLYSCAAVFAQMLIAAAGTPLVAGVGLISAGLVQFSPLKRTCLTHCRNPLTYLLQRWRNGPRSGFRVGFGHGVFCVGCCWALMATTLAAGMSSIWWMVALTTATFVEQVAPRGEQISRAIGFIFIAVGCVTLTA
jgi:predicted metal-binding membrane protein